MNSLLEFYKFINYNANFDHEHFIIKRGSESCKTKYFIHDDTFYVNCYSTCFLNRSLVRYTILFWQEIFIKTNCENLIFNINYEGSQFASSMFPITDSLSTFSSMGFTLKRMGTIVDNKGYLAEISRDKVHTTSSHLYFDLIKKALDSYQSPYSSNFSYNSVFYDFDVVVRLGGETCVFGLVFQNNKWYLQQFQTKEMIEVSIDNLRERVLDIVVHFEKSNRLNTLFN